MSKFLIQSISRGAFLVPDENNQLRWERDLRKCASGVLDDLENVHQMVHEYCDPDDMPVIVELIEHFRR